MSRAAWKQDEAAPACHVCKGSFSLFNRRHHCRACGEVVCGPCSPTAIPVAGYPAPEKACKPCIDAYKHTSVYPVKQVTELCEEYKQRDTDSTGKALTIAKLVLETAKTVVPPPFGVLVHAASMVVVLAERALANTAECIRLACRVARINFIVLEMTTKGVTPAVRQCTEDLTEVFRKAVDLLKRFQGGQDLGWAERIKATYQMYFKNLADDFAGIHAELTTIVQESTLGVALQDLKRCAAPSIEDIRKGVRDEVAHVVEEVERLRQETGEGMGNVQQQLQAILDSPAFARVPARRQVFEPRDVVLDKTTVLGRGAFGVVYPGVLYGQTEVAVKVVPTADVATVEAEIRRTMRVRHPNVVRIFGIVAPDGMEWTAAGVVMERLGVSLETALEEAVQALPIRMKYTLDIIAGMERVHSTDDGVVHFDLKPANILLTLDRRCAKIIDFGVSQSRTTVAMDLAASTRGTVPFMAPEILSGASRPTTACDVYSFAVLLMELWTGTVAWKGTPEAAIVAGVKAGARPLSHVELMAAGVPDSIIALIDACWAQDPHDRPTFAQLAVLRQISNFYEAPQKVWPPFLLSVDQRVSVAAGAVALPSVSQFVKLTIDQVHSVLTQQEIDPSICDWIREKRLNGDLLIASGAKVITRLRNDGLDEFFVDALERIVTKLVKQREDDEARLAQAAAVREAQVEAARRREQEENERVRAEREAKRKAAEDEEARKRAAAEAQAAARKAEADAASARANRIKELPQVYVDRILDVCYQYGGSDEAQLRDYYRRHYHPNYTVTSYWDETGKTTSNVEQCIVGWVAAYKLNGVNSSLMTRPVRRLLVDLKTGEPVEHDLTNARKAIIDVDMAAPSPVSWLANNTVKVEFAAMYRWPGTKEKMAKLWVWFDPETHKVVECRLEQTRPTDPRARQAFEARVQAEDAMRKPEVAVPANRRTMDIWQNSVNMRTEAALNAYLDVVSDRFTAFVTYKQADGTMTTDTGVKSGLPTHYRTDLWGKNAMVVDRRVSHVGPSDSTFTYSVVYPSGYRSNLDAHMYFEPPGTLIKFEVRVL
jgi:serine/threonine protein kinase